MAFNQRLGKVTSIGTKKGTGPPRRFQKREDYTRKGKNFTHIEEEEKKEQRKNSTAY